MIQLNFTLFIQLINFLILLFILNAILYKPILAKIRERENRIAKDREEAKQLGEQIEAGEKKHQEELAKVRQTAAQEKADLLAKAKAKESGILDEARAEASRIVEDMRKTIDAEAVDVRESLKAEMTPLSQSIAQKILGRSV
ncbi:ATP synthase F0 subunit B [Thermodesulfobacteriota bacterium]